MLPLSDEALAADWEELHLKRAARSDLGEYEGEDFTVRVRGGKYTAEKKNVAVDAIVGDARTAQARAWGQRYAMGKMVSFSTILYGEAAAHAMALEWCRRCQFFYNLWVAANDESYQFTPADLEDYREGEEWLAFTSSLDEGHAAWPRIQRLRELVPLNL